MRWATSRRQSGDCRMCSGISVKLESTGCMLYREIRGLAKVKVKVYMRRFGLWLWKYL